MPKQKLVTYRFSCASQWTVKLPEGTDPETLSDHDLTAFAKTRRLVEVAVGVVEQPERLVGGEWEPVRMSAWGTDDDTFAAMQEEVNALRAEVGDPDENNFDLYDDLRELRARKAAREAGG